MKHIRRLPGWLKMQRASGGNYSRVKRIVEDNRLHTICTSGNCPNIGECWNAGTATFMILGDICTRACKFCNTKTGRPLPPDPEEPQRLAESIEKLGLRHCVITSVDRDDLPDGGASFWAEVIRHIKQKNPATSIETLIPDFD
jgi:lipoic acid synthetase